MVLCSRFFSDFGVYRWFSAVGFVAILVPTGGSLQLGVYRFWCLPVVLWRRFFSDSGAYRLFSAVVCLAILGLTGGSLQ